MPRSKKADAAGREFRIKLPATSANLGPAFDAAAIALQMHLHVSARAGAEFSIIATGRDSQICGRLDGNLLLDSYREALETSGKKIVPLAIRIDNEIPIGKGLGSSAAARLAGISLANHFAKLGWSDAHIIAEASRREGHGDNVAACWLGGMAIVSSFSTALGTDCSAFGPKLRTKWPLLVAIAPDVLSTERARTALPENYSRADAVANVQHAMLLTHAFVNGIPELLAQALHDRLHEPYRAPLCPLLEPLRELAGSHGILGAVLSGAGPSVLVVLDSAKSASRAQKAIEALLRSKNLQAELVLTHIETHGARESFPASLRSR